MPRPKSRDRKDSSKGQESFLNVTEVNNRVTPEAVIKKYRRAKILWKPNRTAMNSEKIDKGTKTTFQDYLRDDSSVSGGEITGNSDDYNWPDDASTKKKKIVTRKPENRQLNSESDGEEPSRDRTLIYSPLAVTPGRTHNILDILHENHIRGLERSQALLDYEAGTASIPAKQGNEKPSHQKSENVQKSSIKSTEVNTSAVASEEEKEDAALNFRKPTVRFNTKPIISNQNQPESPLKGIQHKEARKKLFGRPSLSVPNSLTSTSGYTTEDSSSLTVKNRTSQTVSRFEKQLNKLSHLGFLDTPHNLRGLPSFDKSPKTPMTQTSRTIMEAGTKLHNSVNPSSLTKRINASLPNSEHDEIVKHNSSAVQNKITEDLLDVSISPVVFAGSATKDLEHTPDFISPEIRKAPPQKFTESVTKDSFSASKTTILPDVQSLVSPSKINRTGMDEIHAVLNTSYTQPPFQVVSIHHSAAEDMNENQSQEKQSEMSGSFSNSTYQNLDRILKQMNQSGRETQGFHVPVNGTEKILDEETTAGILFEKEMRERKSKKQPVSVQQPIGDSLTDLRKTCVFRHNQLNYCTTDYVPAVEEDPIQVCNAVNSPGLRVNSWKLLTGMSKPIARLATSPALLTVLEGELELQVTQKDGRSDKTYLLQKDFVSIPAGNLAKDS